MFCLPLTGISQGSLVLYQMYHSVPKANQMNPALQNDGKFYISIPVLSGTRINLRSDLALNNIVRRGTNDSLYIDLNKMLSNVHKSEKINFDLNLDLLQFGVRFLGGYGSLNLSLYNHTDILLSSSLLDLMVKGNGATDIIGRRINLGAQEQNAFSCLKIGLGYSRELIKDHLTAGLRLNLINGIAASSLDAKNTGYLYTDPNNYQITFSSGGLQYNMSGDHTYFNGNFNMGNIFSFNNPGFGVDAGALWKFNSQWSVSGSVNNLGMIYWKTDVSNHILKGETYTFNGLNLDNLNFQTLGDTLNNIFNPVEAHKKFTTGLHPNTYVSASYSFGKEQGVSLIVKNSYLKHTLINTTGLDYNKRLGHWLDLSVLYSLYDMHYSMLGFGFAVSVPGFSIYMASDNISGFLKPQGIHAVDFTFGLNSIIF